MNVVDSSGWLEYLAGGPNATFFSAAVEGTTDLLVPTLSIYEVFKRVLTQMADSIMLATARAHGATLWTQDADFAGFPDVRYRSARPN